MEDRAILQDVNLRQLEYVIAIAEQGSFTGAAERLLVAQPSLSHQVRALEQELGGTLLERLPRGTRLTPAGVSFIGEARATVAHAERARRAARMAFGLEAGEIEIATLATASAGILPPLLSRWQQRHPGVHVSLREFVSRRALEEAVRDGQGDLAIGAPPAGWRGRVEPLGWEEFVVVLPERDALLAERAVDLGELADRKWVHFKGDHGLAQILDAQCAAKGFAPRIAVRTSQVVPAPLLAAAGLGPTLVPDNVVPAELRQLTRPLRPRIARRLVAYTRGTWSPVSRAFLDLLHQDPWPRRPRGAEDVG